jgi:transposase
MAVAEAKREVRDSGRTLEVELVELRRQAHFWKAQHERAAQREAAWKERAKEKDEIIGRQQDEILQLTETIAKLQAQIQWFEKRFFGSSSEKNDSSAGDGDEEGSENSSKKRGKRGQRRGKTGHGRKRRPELPTKEIIHDIPEDQRCCFRCGKAFDPFPGTEDSEEIHCEFRVERYVHKRLRYRPTCDCGAVPGILAAPPPPKLIPKGMFTTGFWVWLLQEKFLFQRPLYRTRQVLGLEGLDVSQGTLTGGLQRIRDLVQPLYGRMLEPVRGAGHWHMDETGWRVFVDMEGKTGHRWWLWVVVTDQVCAYLLEPTRSADVPRNLLGENARGIINADRYSAYKALGEGLLIAFCWAHVRRDFVRVRNGYEDYGEWADAWIERIRELYELNEKRLEVLSKPSRFRAKDRALRSALFAMQRQWESELAGEGLSDAQRKPLESLRDHWDGLTLFVEYPWVPMDNNEAERRLRNPVVGRKNYYGSGSIWSGMLAASLFTIYQTLLLNHLDPQKYLTAYFEACAQNGGRPPEDIDRFLPWNLSEEQKAAWGAAERPP